LLIDWLPTLSARRRRGSELFAGKLDRAMLTYTCSWPVFDLSFQRRPQQTGSDEAMTSRPENQPRAPLSDATAGMCTTGHLLASHTAPKGVVQCLLQAFLGRGIPPGRAYSSPPNGCQIVCSEFVFDNELQVCHGNFLLMDYKHRKLFVSKLSQGCKFMPKMHQNTFSGRAPTRPAGRAYTHPQTT